MKRRLTCSVKYFCLGAFLIFLGSVLLCGLGLTIVLPHEMTRDWPEVTCQVINSSYSGRICSCEYQARDFAMDNEQCLDSYPCLHIVVSYTVYGVLGSQQDPENGRKLYDDRFVDTKPSNISLFYDNDRHTYKIVMSRDRKDTPHNKVKNTTIIGHLYRSWEDEFFKTVNPLWYPHYYYLKIQDALAFKSCDSQADEEIDEFGCNTTYIIIQESSEICRLF